MERSFDPKTRDVQIIQDLGHSRMRSHIVERLDLVLRIQEQIKANSTNAKQVIEKGPPVI